MEKNISLDSCSNLGCQFTFWYHNPNENNWSKESYHEILTFSTLEEFWVLEKFIKKDMVENGMFFLMRDGILPIWEDQKNRVGGCISWKIEKKNSYKFWLNCIGHLITSNCGAITPLINGISISPKKSFNIIKYWLNCEVNTQELNLPVSFDLLDVEPIYKSHETNIEKDKQEGLKYKL